MNIGVRTARFLQDEMDAREVYWMALRMAMEKLSKDDRSEIQSFVQTELRKRREDR